MPPSLRKRNAGINTQPKSFPSASDATPALTNTDDDTPATPPNTPSDNNRVTRKRALESGNESSLDERVMIRLKRRSPNKRALPDEGRLIEDEADEGDSSDCDATTTADSDSSTGSPSPSRSRVKSPVIKPVIASKGKDPKAAMLKGALGQRVSTGIVSKAKTIPLADYTLHHLDRWVLNEKDGVTTITGVKCLPDKDAFLDSEELLDPLMRQADAYSGLIPYPNMQLVVFGDSTADTGDDGQGDSCVRALGLSLDAWADFEDITREEIIGFLRMPQQSNLANASTMDLTTVVYKDIWSPNGHGTAYVAASMATLQPMLFVLVGACIRSYLEEGDFLNPEEAKGPFCKYLTVITHMFEFERMSSAFATLWHAPSLTSSIKHRHIPFQTRSRPGSNKQEHQYTRSKAPATPSKVGKFKIEPYNSPSKRQKRAFKPSLDFDSKVPIYDGRKVKLDPNNVAATLESLPPWNDDEVPEGAGVLVGYCTGISKYNGWRITFYVQWVVVLAVD